MHAALYNTIYELDKTCSPFIVSLSSFSTVALKGKTHTQISEARIQKTKALSQFQKLVQKKIVRNVCVPLKFVCVFPLRTTVI